jgi:hypothetical protein
VARELKAEEDDVVELALGDDERPLRAAQRRGVRSIGKMGGDVPT